MPCTKDLIVNTTKPVLVTGATGYVAGVLIQNLLGRGVTVHATVRGDPQANPKRLEYLQKAADSTNGSIRFFQGDLKIPRSFDKAMRDCDIVFHTASPVALNSKNPAKDIVEAAVLGTQNVLDSVNRTPSVRRVVLTSSSSALVGNACETSADRPANEDDWNRASTVSHRPYSLSKTLSEQKAWVMAGCQTRWKLVTILPSFIIGPGLKYHEASETVKLVQLLGSDKSVLSLGVPPFPMGLVDIRDVADAHVAAAYLEEASGRYLVAATTGTLATIGRDIAKKDGNETSVVTKPLPFFLKPLLWLLAPVLGPGMDRQFIANNIGYQIHLDNTKSRTELNMEYCSVEVAAQDLFQQLIDHGAIPNRGQPID